MKLLYRDHSIVTRESGWPDLTVLLKSGKARLGLSLWNLFEIACATDATQKEQRISFLEEFEPLWIRERRDVQAQEIQRFLWRHFYQRIPTSVMQGHR